MSWEDPPILEVKHDGLW